MRPPAVIDSRSMRFPSSRTLPVHGWSASAARVRRAKCTAGRPFDTFCATKSLHDQRQVLDALAQRGHVDGKYVEAMIKVFAEGTAAYRFLEVAMRRRDDADVASDRHVVADALEYALLQYAQKLHLHRGAHVADLIEK